MMYRNERFTQQDPAYRRYVENGESAAVFITRDVVKSIDTTGKWIDILGIKKGTNNKAGLWDFQEITVELFPRTVQPRYPKNVSDGYKKYITWRVAHEDIADQREEGVSGPKYLITLELANKNEGKYRIEEKVWNKTFEQYVPKGWKTTGECEVRKVQVPIKPYWGYRIISVKRIRSLPKS